MKRTLVICISHLPDSRLNPNRLRSLHWTARHKATQEAKAEIGWIAKSQWHDDAPMMMARISYEFHVKDKRRRDLDNLIGACKAYVDGLIEVGVLYYDDARHLEIGGARLVEDSTDKTVLRIQEL